MLELEDSELIINTAPHQHKSEYCLCLHVCGWLQSVVIYEGA